MGSLISLLNCGDRKVKGSMPFHSAISRVYDMRKTVTRLEPNPKNSESAFLPLPKEMLDVLRCEKDDEVFLLYHQKGSFTLTKKPK